MRFSASSTKIFWFHYFCEFDSHPIPREFYLWYAWANDGERKSRPPPWMIFPVSGHITCLREKFRSSQTNAHDLICSVNVLKLLGSSGKKPYSSLLQRERNESAPPLDLLRKWLVKMPWLSYFVTNGDALVSTWIWKPLRQVEAPLAS